MKTWMKGGLALCAIAAVGGLATYAYLFDEINVDSVAIDVDALRRDGFDHSALERVLSTVVDDNGRVDYRALRKAPTSLHAYVGAVGQIGPSSTPSVFKSDAQKLAYYLNAYNAFVLLGVVVRPDITNVHDDKVRFFYGTTFKLDGARTNLFDLENTIIRKTFADPRIHFALNCASMGCPTLPQHAFAPETIDATLAAMTTSFLAEKRNLTVGTDGKAVTVSKIFDWYREDFKPTPLAWIAKNSEHTIGKNASLAFHAWDWSLNDQASAPK